MNWKDFKTLIYVKSLVFARFVRGWTTMRACNKPISAVTAVNQI